MDVLERMRQGIDEARAHGWRISADGGWVGFDDADAWRNVRPPDPLV
jgi:hypothetical protein